MSATFARVFLALALLTSVTIVAGAPAFPRDLPHHRGCGSHMTNAHRISSEARFKTSRIPPKSENSTATVDVYFHVIFANETVEGGYVAQETVEKQIAVLNEDYKTAGVSFNLVNVTRVNSEDWFVRLAPESDAEKEMKGTFRQGNASTLNIWSVGFEEGEGNGLLGYATFPSDYEKAPELDGVVLLHTTMPDNGKPPYNKGRTLTHEAGHWFGLYHTFEGGCQGNNDYVDDTPALKEANYGCPAKKSMCPGAPPALVSNFMDYTDDACMTGFSDGQATRIRAQMRTFRGIDI